VLSQRRYCALIEYDGTDFLGYQVQAKGRTVQGELERTLEKVTQTEIRINGAGRTDAGVHAVGQVITFDGMWRHSLEDLHRALNATLPADIVIKNLKVVDETFHPRFSALSRSYRYVISNEIWPSALKRHYIYHVRDKLDVAAMNQASLCLIGSHDFAAFGKPPQGSITLRQVTRAEWTVTNQWVVFEITANAFLYRMVRKIVASLIKVGLGQWPVGEIQEILASKDLTRSAPPAPACGLCLVRVTYPTDIWDEGNALVEE
jgi:tRNA pseudouridine38-40 synthase